MGKKYRRERKFSDVLLLLHENTSRGYKLMEKKWARLNGFIAEAEVQNTEECLKKLC